MKSEEIRKKLQELIINFEQELESENLRKKVLALIPCFNHLRELGKSLIPADIARSARDRILYYFLKYPRQAVTELNGLLGEYFSLVQIYSMGPMHIS